MIKFLFNLMQNRIILSLIFISLLMISEGVRYKQKMYYNDYQKYPVMLNHVLNKSFNLHKRPNLDYEKINKLLFISSTTSVIVGGLAIIINVWLGLFIYVLSSSILVFYINKKILTLFPEL